VEAFCQQLLVCHGLEVLVDMLHAPDPALKAAGGRGGGAVVGAPGGGRQALVLVCLLGRLSLLAQGPAVCVTVAVVHLRKCISWSVSVPVAICLTHVPCGSACCAGVEAVHAVAVGGGTRCATALLSSAAAPDLVDVVRVQPSDTPLAAAAVAALAALAAAPGGTAAAVEPLVAFLQPSSAAAAGRAASALLLLTGGGRGVDV
jgi:hypothetical protein